MRTIGTTRALRLAASLVLLVAACGPKTPPLTELEPAQLWERGMAAYEAEDWDDALRYFDRFTLVGGSDPRVNEARYYAADAHFQKREYVTAATEFARLAADLGQAELAVDARFKTCRAYEELAPGPQLDQEYTRAAVDHCSALVEHFPQSEHAAAAGEIVDRMWSRLAEKAYRTGDWYFGRNAYDSALIYFEDVVAGYPTTPWAPRALRRMVQVYDRLGWEDEREETRQRLLQEYPDSPEAREVGEGPGAG